MTRQFAPRAPGEGGTLAAVSRIASPTLTDADRAKAAANLRAWGDADLIPILGLDGAPMRTYRPTKGSTR